MLLCLSLRDFPEGFFWRLSWLSVLRCLVVVPVNRFLVVLLVPIAGICPALLCVVVLGCEMACYHPISAWRTKGGDITFKGGQGVGFALSIPCGQCIGCRLERSRQWAVRCMHESQLHLDNCFVTLTYDDEHLPSDGGLRKRDFQLFMKRLRKRYGNGIRYFHCGEYGESLSRPHYHAIIFGLDFPDKILWKSGVGGCSVYISELLADLWPNGFSSLGDVTFESCAYVARYVMKKVTGSAAEEHYSRLIPETGEIVSILPEYVSMSLKPGIGARWHEKFSSDVFPEGSVVMRGREMRSPRYYDKLFEKVEPEAMDLLKSRRLKRASTRRADNTPERLKVRERVKSAQCSMLKRSMEV